jgi:alpha-tubulin suppressor-like RCC1 family protein
MKVLVRRLVAALVTMAAGVPLLVVGAPAEAAAPPSAPWTWGGNSFGELGNGTTVANLNPAAVSGLTDVVDIHGGREHVVALKSDGTVWVWGSNAQGQLGLGTSANVSVPTRVTSLSGIAAVETGHNHSMALTSTGQVWTWGLNTDGQLGDGTTTLRRSPVRVSGLTDAVAIAAGRDMSYAIRADGTVVGWGRNAEGGLGDGTTTRRLTPVRVGTLTQVVAIAGGRDHGLALRNDGTVWAWGANAYGQVGDGTLTNRTTPAQVATGMTEVIAGAHHSYALRSDGQVAAWGRNYRDELGDGTTTTRRTPVLVHGVSNAVTIGSGRDHGLAVLADGTVRAWGYNASGQLGDGTTTNRNAAVTVRGVTGAVKAGGGGQAYSVILVGSSTPPPNQPPTARATFSCALLDCTFDGSTSGDVDGQVLGYAWDFGDGGTDTAAAPPHSFESAGTYPVTLTVTDDDGDTGSTVLQVTVSDQPPPAGVTFRAAAATDANTTSASVVVPGAAQAGDRLLMVVTTNRTATLTVPSGWTQLGVVTDGTEVRSWLLTRVADAASAGSTVRVPLDALSKTSLTLTAYDAGAVSAFASAAETGSSTSHVAPASTVAVAGSTVLRYWADKTSTVHGWTLPAGLTQRASTTGSSGGMLTSVTGDSAGWAVGPVPTATAVAGTSASKGVSWTIVLPPG